MIFLKKKMGALRSYIVYIVEDSTDYTLNKLWDSFFGGGVAGELGEGGVIIYFVIWVDTLWN